MALGAALAAFNALVPRPLGVRREAGLSYGPLRRQKADVYRPPGRGPWPLLMLFYGGGWEEGSREDYAFAGRAYAGRGFCTVTPDYRVTSEAPYPAFLEDCATATAWAQGQGFGADPARTVLAGHSAGAYNAAMLALDPAWLTAAGAAYPIRAWAGLAGPYDFLPLSAGPARRTFASAKDVLATQPVAHVRADSPPAFLAWGAKDRVVSPTNSERLAALLRAASVEVRTEAFAHAGHAELVLALAWPLSLRTPVLRDSARFLHAWSGQDAR